MCARACLAAGKSIKGNLVMDGLHSPTDADRISIAHSLIFYSPSLAGADAYREKEHFSLFFYPAPPVVFLEKSGAICHKLQTVCFWGWQFHAIQCHRQGSSNVLRICQNSLLPSPDELRDEYRLEIHLTLGASRHFPAGIVSIQHPGGVWPLVRDSGDSNQ